MDNYNQRNVYILLGFTCKADSFNVKLPKIVLLTTELCMTFKTSLLSADPLKVSTVSVSMLPFLKI